MVERKRRQVPAMMRSVHVPGLVLGASGVSFSLEDISATEHYFCANGFEMALSGGDLHILLGAKSAFESGNKFRLAIELEIPIAPARAFLYEVIWNQPGQKGIGNYIETVRVAAEATKELLSKPSYFADKKTSSYELPVGSDNFRNFAANFVASTVSAGQAMLEFFEAPPDALVGLMNSTARPNSQVRSIVGVIMSPILALQLYERAKEILEPLRSKEEI